MFLDAVPPPTRSPTVSLKIDRFVRPFTIKAVKELLEQTGSVKQMWMDQIKTHCFVTVWLAIWFYNLVVLGLCVSLVVVDTFFCFEWCCVEFPDFVTASSGFRLSLFATTIIPSWDAACWSWVTFPLYSNAVFFCRWGNCNEKRPLSPAMARGRREIANRWICGTWRGECTSWRY